MFNRSCKPCSKVQVIQSYGPLYRSMTLKEIIRNENEVIPLWFNVRNFGGTYLFVLLITQLNIHRSISIYCLRGTVHTAQTKSNCLFLPLVSLFNKQSRPGGHFFPPARYLDLHSASASLSAPVCLFGEYSSPSTTWKYVSAVGSCLEKRQQEESTQRERRQEGRRRREGDWEVMLSRTWITYYILDFFVFCLLSAPLGTD